MARNPRVSDAASGVATGLLTGLQFLQQKKFSAAKLAFSQANAKRKERQLEIDLDLRKRELKATQQQNESRLELQKLAKELNVIEAGKETPAQTRAKQETALIDRLDPSQQNLGVLGALGVPGQGFKGLPGQPESAATIRARSIQDLVGQLQSGDVQQAGILGALGTPGSFSPVLTPSDTQLEIEERNRFLSDLGNRTPGSPLTTADIGKLAQLGVGTAGFQAAVPELRPRPKNVPLPSGEVQLLREIERTMPSLSPEQRFELARKFKSRDGARDIFTQVSQLFPNLEGDALFDKVLEFERTKRAPTGTKRDPFRSSEAKEANVFAESIVEGIGGGGSPLERAANFPELLRQGLSAASAKGIDPLLVVAELKRMILAGDLPGTKKMTPIQRQSITDQLNAVISGQRPQLPAPPQQVAPPGGQPAALVTPGQVDPNALPPSTGDFNVPAPPSNALAPAAGTPTVPQGPPQAVTAETGFDPTRIPQAPTNLITPEEEANLRQIAQVHGGAIADDARAALIENKRANLLRPPSREFPEGVQQFPSAPNQLPNALAADQQIQAASQKRQTRANRNNAVAQGDFLSDKADLNRTVSGQILISEKFPNRDMSAMKLAKGAVVQLNSESPQTPRDLLIVVLQQPDGRLVVRLPFTNELKRVLPGSVTLTTRPPPGITILRQGQGID